jgi:hypothetical protein
MKRRKKAKTAEYRLNIFHASDKETGKRFVAFLVRTVKEFASFNYEIVLNVTQRDRSLHVEILGMNAPPMIMGGTGPATGRRNLTGLRGVYTVVVTKLDHEANAFMLNVEPDQISVVEAPPDPFVLVSVDPVIE